MSGSWKYILTLFAAVIAIYVVAKIAIALVVSAIGHILALLVPIAIVVGVAYVLYSLITRKALGGGSRRSLP